MEHDKYSPQKKSLEKQKQLRVWVNSEKYEQFKFLAQKNGQSLYSIVNKMIDQYILSLIHIFSLNCSLCSSIFLISCNNSSRLVSLFGNIPPPYF